MASEPRIEIPRDEIAALCRRYDIASLSLFGSVLRDDFRPDSDVDVLVEFLPDARPSFWALMDIEQELTGIVGRKVDLVERDAVERSRNYIRRRSILRSAEPLHVAG